MRTSFAAVFSAALLGGIVGAGITVAIYEYGSPSRPAHSITASPKDSINRQPLKAAVAKLNSQVEIGLTLNDLAASLTDIQSQTSLIESGLNADQRAAVKVLLDRGKKVLDLWRTVLKSGCPENCEYQLAAGFVELGILKQSTDWFLTTDFKKRSMLAELGGRSGLISSILTSLADPLASAQAAL